MCEPIVSIIRISANFFLYGSNFCIFTALGLILLVGLSSLRTKDSMCCFRTLSFLTVSLLYIAFRWCNESVLMSMLSCLTAVLSTQFWPTAKQDINNRTINPIDFFGTFIQIPILTKRPIDLSIVKRLGGFWWCKITALIWDSQTYFVKKIHRKKHSQKSAFWKRRNIDACVWHEPRFEIDIESKWVYSHIKLSFIISYILFQVITQFDMPANPPWFNTNHSTNAVDCLSELFEI